MNNNIFKYPSIIILLILFYTIITLIPIKNNSKTIENKAYQDKIDYYESELKEINKINNSNLPKENTCISKILFRNIDNFYNEIISTSCPNIKENYAVINEDGLIGIVNKIKKDKVYIKLITSNNNISIKVNDTYGNLNNNKITLLDKENNIKKGDKVYTSGLDGLPSNIYVGEITKIVNKELSSEATINLIKNKNIDYILIVGLE